MRALRSPGAGLSEPRRRGPRPTPIEILFWSKVNLPSAGACWHWLAATDPQGYGVFGVWDPEKKRARVRRAWVWAFILLYGSRPEGRSPRWTCGDHACINPRHIYFRARSRSARPRRSRLP